MQIYLTREETISLLKILYKGLDDKETLGLFCDILSQSSLKINEVL